MFDSVRTETGVRVTVEALLPAALAGYALQVGQIPARPFGDNIPLASASDADLASDPLARLQVEVATQALTERIEALADAQEDTAHAVLARWRTAGEAAANAWRAGDLADSDEEGFSVAFTDDLSIEEAYELSAWCNRVYQVIRVAELNDAGAAIEVGAGEAVNDFLAELLGADPGHTSEVELTPFAMMFAIVATNLLITAHSD